MTRNGGKYKLPRYFMPQGVINDCGTLGSICYVPMLWGWPVENGRDDVLLVVGRDVRVEGYQVTLVVELEGERWETADV